MPVYLLNEQPFFPPATDADPDGLIAVGGDLSVPRLLNAYSQGIFPWFEEDGLFYWFSPDPRLVLFPGNLKISSSLNRTIKSKKFEDVFSDELTTLQSRVSVIPQDVIEPSGPFESIIIVMPNVRYYLLRSLVWVIAGSILFIIVVLAAFFVTIRSLMTQKKLVEIKRDFINNMTHELKTPLATISLAVDALRSSKVNTDAKSVEYFSNIIKEENLRMNKHVEAILQAAQIDKKENQLNKQAVDVHDLIQGVVESFKLQLEGKPSNVQTLLEANPSLIQADEEHLLHLLSNLIDNAIKYAKENIDLVIKTKSINNRISIQIYG